MLALNFTNSAVTNFGSTLSTQSFDDHVWQFEDSMTWTKGRHNIKFGGQFWRQNIKTFYAGNNGQLGLMDFDGRFTSSASRLLPAPATAEPTSSSDFPSNTDAA